MAALAKEDALLVDGDHDQPPAWLRGLRAIEDVAWLWRRRDLAGRRPQRDVLRLDDAAGVPVDRHRELRWVEVGDRLAIAVDDADVDLDHVDAAPKRR